MQKQELGIIYIQGVVVSDLICHGALAQWVEHSSKVPGSGCNSTDESWVRTPAGGGENPSGAVWRKIGIKCEDREI